MYDILSHHLKYRSATFEYFSITAHLTYSFVGEEPTEEPQTLSVPITVITVDTPGEETADTHSPERGVWSVFLIVLGVGILAALIVLLVLRRRQQNY